MAENSIEQVRAAETEAEQTARDAARQAEQILSEARESAAGLATQTGDAARAKAASDVQAAHDAGRKALQDALTGLGADMDALAEKARAAQPKATQMILDALV